MAGNKAGENSREEGAAAEHARLEQSAGRAQEEFHIVASRKLRQPRVQLGRHHHRARQVRVHLATVILNMNLHSSSVMSASPTVRWFITPLCVTFGARGVTRCQIRTVGHK